MSEPVKPRRPYNSERRRDAALRTRQRILDAAAARFVEHGFAGTTIAAVAARRRDRRRDRLRHLRVEGRPARRGRERRGTRGTTDIEILEQEGRRAVAAAHDQREQLELFALDISERLARTAPLLRAVAGAAPGEPELAALLERSHEARLRNIRSVAAMLARNGPLRIEPEEAAETIWALASPDLYLLFTGARGWSRERYAAWLADSLEAVLSAPAGGRPAARGRGSR